MTESKFYHISSSGLIYRVNTLEEAVKSLDEDGFIWLDYYNPEKKDISILTDIIGIHPLSVEDCFDEKQVPKIEYFHNNTFILFNALSYKDKTLYLDEVNLFIGSNFLITISGHDADGRMPLKNISIEAEHNIMNVKNGPAYLLHVVLDHLVDEKYIAFDTMEDELEEAEETLLDDVSVFHPMQLVHLRRKLVSLRKSLYHEREILVKINRLDCPFIPEKTMAQYRDIYDHLSKFFELTETYRELETSLMELYTSLLNNKMTLASNETNITVKRLTVITTVFLPLTLIASIGGMSEWTMITGGEANWKTSYAILLIFMIIMGGLSYYFIRAIEKGIFLSGKKKRNENQSVSDMPA
ncbi:MAG TPA: magnesium transporter CorA family protein [Bacteroidales bacterium]|nr:Mg2+/Co2+ transporter [Bacteroidales bacterium]HNR42708.1 magnesium transporter CorA family protein [Bacteroidales bacterium]HPM18218.1 magnesium transporter CorA family protein [Bacteroidales bacterium]HQG78559.1 magnesium transporter CorA family protein [Bacteroidales bacterium]